MLSTDIVKWVDYSREPEVRTETGAPVYGKQGRKLARPQLMPGGKAQKLTEEVAEKVCEALRLGCYVETAALRAGISKTTLHAWMHECRKEYADPDLQEFARRIDEAMAEGEMLALQKVVAADEWQSAAWRLERRYPEKWGRVDRLKAEHTGKDGAQLVVFAIT